MENKDTKIPVTQGGLQVIASEVQVYKIWFGHEDGPREGGIWILSQ